MIGISNLVMYTIGAALIIVSPGPDFIYVTTRGVAHGKKAGVISAAGISIGLLIHTTLAALGLSALLQTSGIAFQTIKLAGALYLAYLGIRMLLEKKALVSRDDSIAKKEINGFSIFQQGMLTNVLNPKAIITFMAFIPQFINPADGNPTLQVMILGGVIVLLAIVWFGCVGYFSGKMGQWIIQNQFLQRIIQKVSGVVLIGLGLKLAMSENK